MNPLRPLIARFAAYHASDRPMLVMVLMLFLLAQAVFSSRLLLTQDVSRLRVKQRQERVHASLARVPGVDTVEENGNLQIITLSGDFLFDPDDTRMRG